MALISAGLSRRADGKGLALSLVLGCLLVGGCGQRTVAPTGNGTPVTPAATTASVDSVPATPASTAAPVPSASAGSPTTAPSGSPTTAPSGSPTTAPSAVTTVPVAAALTAPAPAAGSRSSLPVSLTIPALGIDTKLDRLGVDKLGVLIPPVRWDTAGWFAAGTVPGDVGPALVAGHIDSTSGPAVFAKLSTVKAGTQVYITRADGSRLTFVVDSGQSYPKAAFPTAVVYGPTPLRALRLVTCTGQFDHASGHYLDNYVVFAHLVA